MGGSTAASTGDPTTTAATGTTDTSTTGGGSGGAGAAGGMGGASSTASGGSGGTAGSAGSGSGGTGGEPAFVEPTLLSETGLYTDLPSETLAPEVMEFTPNFVLWTDGATKRRWVYLPPGSRIDSYKLDYWTYPVGTKLWKEFTRDGVRVETRLLQKLGDDEWFMMAFEWNDEGTDAVAVPEGRANARSTEHDIPSQENCTECHGNMPDKSLGFTALQLSHDGPGVTLDQLIDEQRLNAPPSAPLVIPGDDVERAALGYLHSNCGHCHNDGGTSMAYSKVDMELWLHTGELGDVAGTATYTTTIDQYTQASTGLAGIRVAPGDVENSILYQRFTSDDPDVHMPPLGTEIVDPAGLQIIEDWIASLQ